MWDVCAEVRAIQFTFREAQSYWVTSVKCTRKNFIQIRWCSVCCCYLHVFSDLSLSQGWNGHHLDSASYCRDVPFGKRSLQASNSWQFISLMCKVKKHIRISLEETWQEVTQSKHVFTESLSVIGEENLIENVSHLCIHQNSTCHFNFSTLKQRIFWL